MPRWREDERGLGPVVQGFTARGFSVDGVAYEAVLLTPESAGSWSPPPIGELRIEDLASILPSDLPPEFLILGTGRATAFPPRELVRALEARGIGIETMDSRAAARTWGMLRSEGRRIVAALMPLV